MEICLETLKECFAELPDPRVVERTTHGLVDILFLTLCAVICGMDDWESIEVWGEVRLDWLRQFVPLENGIPSHDTIARVFAALDSKQFQASFLRWMSSLCPSLEGQIVAIDAYSAEVFFIEESRKVGKTNVFSVNGLRHECPVDLREKSIQVRYDRMRRDQFIVYFDGQRMGEALLLDLHANARLRAPALDGTEGAA